MLAWIVSRLQHEVDAAKTPIGRVPFRHDLDLEGLDLPDDDLRALLTVDPVGWRRECDAIEGLFSRFGDRVPAVLTRRLGRLRRRLAAAG